MKQVYYSKGSYGYVYKQGNLITKVVPYTYIDTLFNEIAILRMINSEYTPQIISVSMDEDIGSLVMPYYGINLSDYLRTHVLSEQQKLDMIRQLLTVVCDIHSSNIIHCDIKSNNIVVNDNGRITLIDFGISRLWRVEDIGNSIKFPLDGYGSPEIYLGYQSLSKSSDMWSVGCIIYEILYGRRLFSVHNYMHSVVSQLGIPFYFKSKHKISYDEYYKQYLTHGCTIRADLIPFFQFDVNKRITCYEAYKSWVGSYYITKHNRAPLNLYVLSAGSNIINDLIRAMSNIEFDRADILSCVNIVLQLNNPSNYIYAILYVVGLLGKGVDIDSIIDASKLTRFELYSQVLDIVSQCNLISVIV